jgi:hypothetical protein
MITVNASRSQDRVGGVAFRGATLFPSQRAGGGPAFAARLQAAAARLRPW